MPLCEAFRESFAVVSDLANCVAEIAAARVVAAEGGGEVPLAVRCKRPAQQEGYILGDMDSFEDALSLCTLLSSMEVSQLPACGPRAGAKRPRSEDLGEGEDYMYMCSPRVCAGFASAPLAFLALVHNKWPSFVLVHFIDEGVPFGTDRAITDRLIFCLLNTPTRHAECEMRRCLEMLDDAGLLDAADALRAALDTYALDAGTLRSPRRPTPAIASFEQVLLTMLPRGAEAPSRYSNELGSEPDGVNDFDDSVDGIDYEEYEEEYDGECDSNEYDSDDSLILLDPDAMYLEDLSGFDKYRSDSD